MILIKSFARVTDITLPELATAKERKDARAVAMLETVAAWLAPVGKHRIPRIVTQTLFVCEMAREKQEAA